MTNDKGTLLDGGEAPAARARDVTLTTIIDDFVARAVPPNEDRAAYERIADELRQHVLRAVERRIAEKMGDLQPALETALHMETRAVDRGFGFETHGEIQAHLVRPPRRRNVVGYDEVASAVLVSIDVLRMMR